MKRIVLATALACAAMGASADVTVYGRMDLGMMYDHGEDATTMESGIAGASRIGFKGTEKISDDLKVGFVLEGKLTSDDGIVGTNVKEAKGNDVFFDREAAIYVYTPYGDLRIGRSGALGGGSNGGIFGGHVSPFGTVYKSAASSAIHAQETRFDNQVRYDSPVFGGLKVMAQYSNGNGNDASRLARYAAIGASYKVGDLSLVAVYDRVYNKGLDNDTQYFKVGAQYKLAPVTFYAGYQHADNAQVGNLKLDGDAVKAEEVDSFTFGTRVGVAGGNLNMAVGYVKGESEEDGVSFDVERMQAAIGYTYALTKRTTLYAAAAYLKTDIDVAGVAVEVDSSKQVMAGIAHTF